MKHILIITIIIITVISTSFNLFEHPKSIYIPSQINYSISISVKKILYVNIKQYESLKLNNYKDGTGKDKNGTIGYGHLIQNNEHIPNKIDSIMAIELLVSDVEKRFDYLNIYTNLNIYQKCALVDFIFNLGIGTFNKSGIPELIENNQLDSVPIIIDKYKHITIKTNNIDYYILKYDVKKINGNKITYIHPKLEERRQFEISLWNQTHLLQ